jgi:hypothetical protein
VRKKTKTKRGLLLPIRRLVMTVERLRLQKEVGRLRNEIRLEGEKKRCTEAGNSKIKKREGKGS